jgi:hypothetical protein
LGLIIGFTAVSLAIYWATRRTGSGYWSLPLFQWPDWLQAAQSLPQKMWVQLSGAHVYTIALQADPWAAAGAWIWSGVLLLSLLMTAVRMGRGRSFTLAVVSALGIVAACAATLPMNQQLFCYRYLLPVNGLLVFLLATGLSASSWRSRWARGFTTAVAFALVLTGVGAALELGQLNLWTAAGGLFPEQKATTALLEDLHQREVRHVYCLDSMFQWNILFLSDEQVQARWIAPRDRVPAYPLAVDGALLAKRPVALVGWAEQASTVRSILAQAEAGPYDMHMIKDRFFVLYQPRIELLRGLGFRLNELPR